MKRLSRLIIAAGAILVSAASAFAQGSVLQGGPAAPGRSPMYVGQTGPGGQAIVQDSGAAGGGPIGMGLAEQLLTIRNPLNVYPAANAGTGQLFTNACNYDAPINNATGFHYLCSSPNAQGGGLIAYGFGGGATALPFQFNINGTFYTFPFTVGGIVGPATTVVGDIAVWNNLTGTLLKDVPSLQIFGTQTANFGLFGPTTGAAAFPTFRAMVLADLPSVNASSLLGNPTGAPATASQITLDSTLGFSGTTLKCTTATNSQVGCVEPDGSTITISGGVISATAAKVMLSGTVLAKTAAYPAVTGDCGSTITLGGSAQYTLTLNGASGYAANCGFLVTNLSSETSSKTIAANGLSPCFLYPGQSVIINNESNVWNIQGGPNGGACAGRWRLPTAVTLYVRPDGADTCDGLTNAAFTSGAGCAMQTANKAALTISSNFDINANGGGAATIIHTCGSPPCTISSAGQLLQLVGVSFTGGSPTYKGDCTTPTNVKLSPSSSVNADIQITFITGASNISICGFELAGGSNVNYGIYTSGGAQVNLSGPMQIDAISSTPTSGYPAGIGLGANSGGQIYLNATIFFTANIGAPLSVTNGGYMENGGAITINTSNTPAWGTGFIFASWNGRAALGGTLFNGTGATGNSCKIQYGGEVTTQAGGGTFFPGNTACSTGASTVSDSAGNRGNYN